jgi:hypothetical protein
MSIYNGRKNGWILEFAGLCERLYNTYYLRKNVIRDDGFLPEGNILLDVFFHLERMCLIV